jgi:hypothetical protein
MKDGYHWVDASPGGLLLVLPLLPLHPYELKVFGSKKTKGS